MSAVYEYLKGIMSDKRAVIFTSLLEKNECMTVHDMQSLTANDFRRMGMPTAMLSYFLEVIDKSRRMQTCPCSSCSSDKKSGN